MWNLRVSRLLPLLVLVAATRGADKQIKLEDIEKDNLKSDHQAKLEKQYEQYRQYQPQALDYQSYQAQAAPHGYQQAALAYQQALAYQPQQQQQQGSPYSQYVLPFNPQQYIQQSVYQGQYPQVGSNAINNGYQSQGPAHPFQSYFSQQLQPVPVPAGQVAGNPQQQAVVMAYSSPSIAAFQQQAAAYYQSLPPHMQQYVPSQAAQIAPFYHQYQPDVPPTPAAAVATTPPRQSTPLLYSQQQYVPNFQPITSSRTPPSYSPSASQYSQASLQAAYLQSVTPSPYTSSQVYSQTAEPPTYISSLKSSSPHSAASLGQQHQYLQSIESTVSPLQSKYLNSPQYLSQNYNTISSSHLIPKSAYSGLKPTASTSLKIANQGGFLPNNPNSSSSGSPNYQQYRSISG